MAICGHVAADPLAGSWQRPLTSDVPHLSASQLTGPWTAATISTDHWLHSVTYGNGMYVAVGDNGTILTSTNAHDWKAANVATQHFFYGVAFGAGEFVAAGTQIWSSTDGTNWNLRLDYSADNPFYVNAVAYGGNGFVGAGLAGGDTGAAWSPDGSSWERFYLRTYPASGGGLLCVCYGEGQYVAAGGLLPMADNLGTGTIIRSERGRRWTQVESGTEGFIRGIAHGKNTFVAVGNTAKPRFLSFSLTSPDGTNWTRRDLGFWPNAVTYAKGPFFAVGLNGAIAASLDGTVFELIPHEPGSDAALYGVTCGGGRVVAVGLGVILTADLVAPQFTGISTTGVLLQTPTTADLEVSGDLRTWKPWTRVSDGATTLELGGHRARASVAVSVRPAHSVVLHATPDQILLTSVVNRPEVVPGVLGAAGQQGTLWRNRRIGSPAERNCFSREFLLVGFRQPVRRRTLCGPGAGPCTSTAPWLSALSERLDRS